MYWVYILKSGKDESFYVGQTKNLGERLRRHNAGLEGYTKKKIPWELVWATEVSTRAEAMALERKLKNFKSRRRTLEFIESHPSKYDGGNAGPVA